MPVDLTDAKARAELVAREWGLELGEPFAFAYHSYAAPAGDDAVLKVAWEGDDEALHDAEAYAVWDGRGAVRVLRRDAERRALLLERARPGSDISDLPDEEAMALPSRSVTNCGSPRERRSDGSATTRRAGSNSPSGPTGPPSAVCCRWLGRSMTSCARGATGSYTATSTTTTCCVTRAATSRSIPSPT
jgi:hypothetical protein